MFFYKTPESGFEPLQIEQNKLVGQKSGFGDAYQKQNEAKNLRDLAFENPQTIDVCYVPPTVNGYFVVFHSGLKLIVMSHMFVMILKLFIG